MNKAFLLWLLLANLYAFSLFAWDKSRAKSGATRISELHLLTVSALGGWPGGLAAMLLLRHKTAKRSFRAKFAFATLVCFGHFWVFRRHAI